MFSHPHIHKHTWSCPNWKTDNETDHALIDKRRHFRVAYCDTHHCLVTENVGERISLSKRTGQILIWRVLVSKKRYYMEIKQRNSLESQIDLQL
jgi:hypothetical protein